jgi:hypothetical protein
MQTMYVILYFLIATFKESKNKQVKLTLILYFG